MSVAGPVSAAGFLNTLVSQAVLSQAVLSQATSGRRAEGLCQEADYTQLPAQVRRSRLKGPG